MSAVFLNVGQCGIQLGQSFWREVEEWTARNAKAASLTTAAARPSPSVRSQASSRLSGGSIGSSPATSSSKRSAYLPYSLLNESLPCLWLDTESKVINACHSASNSASSRNNNSALTKSLAAPDCSIVLPERSGRGSNWAYGYCGGTGRVRKSTSLLAGSDEGLVTVKSVEERMRKMVERCDRFGGTVLMHSLAGGTGSGTDLVGDGER